MDEKERKWNREYGKRYRKKRKLEMIEYKGGCCQLCGYDKYNSAMDFHHIELRDKDINIINGSSFETAKAELDKCILLCANCHRGLHAEEITNTSLPTP